MLSAFVNSLKIPDLRSRIYFTFGVVFLCRILAAIPAPGVNPQALRDFFAQSQQSGGGLLDMFNLFTGGALEQRLDNHGREFVGMLIQHLLRRPEVI